MGKPTNKMIDFARAIADYLSLEEPDYNDFDAVSEFIAEHKDDYYEERRLFG